MKHVDLIAGEHAVLLIHGLQGTPTEMLPLARRLHKAGYTVRVPHFKGYGLAVGDGAHAITPWQEWRSQVLVELRDMKRQYKTVALGGLCMGAVLSLSVAEEASSEISGLTLLSTTLFYDGWSIPWYRFVLPLGYYTPFRYLYRYKGRAPYGIKNAKLQQWIVREVNHKASAIAAAANLSLPAIHEAELLIKSVKRNLSRVTAPALIIHAVEDDVSTPRSADYVVNNVGSHKVIKITLHDSYHMITLDNEREQVADATIGFLNNLNGQDGTGKHHVLPSAPHLSLVHSA
jgi:carboxylesterase